ncbi:hypothetical protein BTO05_10680 [Winogradskyella sp. PC-19]|uniref:M28 family peptidase n=1 Tax=unclassified Winogradskyella TaxID=2615021 RepID=UPI000B3D4CF5|nr:MULTISPECIES: M28 family peptidase [unclassified Winogradskyella]ARV10079.1 hypothetical protein BTO05_10680 [Winogradskyella sp. PC-19]
MKKVYTSFFSLVFTCFFANAQFVEDVINAIRLDSLERKISDLSGETSSSINGANTTITTRVSSNNDLAAEYIKDHFEALGNISINDQAYNGGSFGTGRNIIATQTGTTNPNDVYLICAHYDSVAAFCADDNATGTSAVLEIARILSTYETENTIVYALWDQEENGLRGSNFYAEEASNVANGGANRVNIVGVVNMDMMGYDGDPVGSAGDNQFDIDLNFSTSSTAIKDDLLALVTTYNFDLNPIVVQPGTPASDHKPFWDEGYGAVLVGESWETVDQTPFYHTSSDKLATLDLPYYHEMVKLVASYTATKANIIKVLSSEELLNRKFSIYPNPVDSILNIETAISETLSLEFYDINGKVIKRQSINKDNSQVNISEFTKGIYFVNIISSLGETTFKFVKE